MVVGVIAEYNPFHSGHYYHLQESKNLSNATALVVVLSGNFVQRGAPAVCDKYARTRMALQHGADLVLELPVYYATASAEYFSKCAVALLHHTHIIDKLSFGCEDADLSVLQQIARLLVEEPPLFQQTLQQHLQRGVSFPVARQEAINTIIGKKASFLNMPNNILAIEYLKALHQLGTPIRPMTIKREGAGYHSKSFAHPFCSATAIREALARGERASLQSFLPDAVYEILMTEIAQKKSPLFWEDFRDFLYYKITTTPLEELSQMMDITEGLENRIVQQAPHTFSVTQLVDAIKTKRYPWTKIQRSLLHLLLDMKTETFHHYNTHGGPQYIRVLGFRKEKSGLLKQLTDKATLPVVLNLKDAENQLDGLGMSMLEKEIATTDIYYLGLRHQQKSFDKNIEYRIPLVIV